MRIIFLIFLGGGFGSTARYLVNRWIAGLITSVFPYGTLLVNISGCFLIGFLIFFSERFGTHALNWRIFLVTGFCGGYTTFSSFSFENLQLISNHQIMTFMVYTVGSVTIGLLATYIGILVARSI